jgi:hypothetical protein
MNQLRYRLYREHKYVSFMISTFRANIAKIDFCFNENINTIKEGLLEITELMHGHASHENTAIHSLLKAKNSDVYQITEEEHDAHANCFEKLNQILEKITNSTNTLNKIELGHQFYLEVQRFEAENLLHQIYEETVIMSELQRLYTDEELLNKIEAKTYAIMTPEQMIHMMEVLFPHFNADDRASFLNDIYQTEPAKFITVWNGISSIIDVSEREHYAVRFSHQLNSTDKQPNIHMNTRDQLCH